MKQFIPRNQGYSIKLQLQVSVYATLKNCGTKMSTWVLSQHIYNKPNYKVKTRV